MPTTNLVHHLDKQLYANPKNTFVIHMGLRRKQDAFVGDVAAKAAGQLKAYLTKHTIPTHAWIFFPNRLSLVVQPTSAKSIFTIADEVQKLIKERALPKDAEFYGDFLDHLLRKTENPRAKASELLLQCVPANLAANPCDYAYCGSTLYPIQELATQHSLVLESAYATN